MGKNASDYKFGISGLIISTMAVLLVASMGLFIIFRKCTSSSSLSGGHSCANSNGSKETFNDDNSGPYGFLSLRYGSGSPKDFAHMLKDGLEKLGHRIFLCSAGTGESFGDQIKDALRKCNYVVPLVTKDPLYGANCGGTYTTYYELRYAQEREKKICPVMMYDGPWPPKDLIDKLDKAGDQAGAAQIDYTFLPAQVALYAGKWTQERAQYIAEQIHRTSIDNLNP